MSSAPAGHHSVVEEALLEYQRSPGKFALLRREPQVLFSCLKEVLQLAGGRAPGGESEAAPLPEVQQAACFFIRAALLHPGADHYALLGLEANSGADAVRDRYRLMMRLMHPDFSISGAAQAWPSDTAARVNRAYEVLSSAQQRSAYDAALEAPGFSAARSTARSAAGSATTLRADARESSNDKQLGLKILAAVFGTGGVVLLLGIVLGSSDRENLVQRTNDEPAPATVAARPPPRVVTPVPAAATRVAPPGAEPAIVASRQEPLPVITAVDPAPAARPSPPAALPPVALAPSAPPAAVRPAPAPVFAVVAAPAAPNRSTTGQGALRITTSVSTASLSQLSQARPTPPVPVVAIAPVPVTTLAPAAHVPSPVVAAIEPPAPAPAAPRPNPGVTLAQVHPLLDKLVQQVESGLGDKILGMLDRDARNTPGAQALMRQYNSLVDGSRAVKVSQVQFHSEPLEGRLLVTGHLVMDVGTAAEPGPGKEFSLQAEFVARDGGVIMTRLARAQGPAPATPRLR